MRTTIKNKFGTFRLFVPPGKFPRSEVDFDISIYGPNVYFSKRAREKWKFEQNSFALMFYDEKEKMLGLVFSATKEKHSKYIGYGTLYLRKEFFEAIGLKRCWACRRMNYKIGEINGREAIFFEYDKSGQWR